MNTIKPNPFKATDIHFKSAPSVSHEVKKDERPIPLFSFPIADFVDAFTKSFSAELMRLVEDETAKMRECCEAVKKNESAFHLEDAIAEEGAIEGVTSEPKKPENAEQVIIVRYKKGGLNGDDLSWIQIDRPDGKYKDDEIALCGAVGKILHQDIPEISEVKAAKILSAELLDFITDFFLAAYKEATRNAH